MPLIRNNILISCYRSDLVNGHFTVPDGVTSIGEEAFFYLTGLTSITIPDGVKYICPKAFQGCTGLTSIIMPDGTKQIGRAAFYDCTNLKSVTLGNNLQSIDERAFHGCKNLTSIIIPNSATRIGKQAFYDCKRLISITIPNNIESIGEEAFCGCKSLTSITIPRNSRLKLIDESMFRDCIRLKSVVIPDGIKSIRQSVFHGCTGLESVTLSNSVTSIGLWAFRDCTNIEQVLFDKPMANTPNPRGLTLLDRIIDSGASDAFIKTMIFAGASFTEAGLLRLNPPFRHPIRLWGREYQDKEHQRAALYARALEVFYAHQCETTGYAKPTNISSLPNELWFQILGLDANSHPEFPLLTNDDLRNIANQSVADAAARLKESIAAQYKRALKNSVLYRYQNHGLHCLSQLGQQQADEARWHDWKQAGRSTAMALSP